MKVSTCNFFGKLFLMVFVLSTVAVTAARADGDDKKHGKSDEHHKNVHLAAFFGLSSGDETDFAMGGDVSYRLPFMHRMFSVAAFADTLPFAKHGHSVLGAGLYVHPFEGAKVLVGPAIALSEVEKTDTGAHKSAAETETHEETGFRAGVAYDVHLGDFSVTPTFNLDFFDGETTPVFGLSIGIGL